ncbi:MAG TPA: hypothetical protein VEH55_02365 [Gaiellaceae bacterium]|jgi:hypothetical protein|nr:hypothetical protein [Gaiellaceae bacterium]
MAHTRTTSLVHRYASMTPDEFEKSIEPKWQAAELLVTNVRAAVERRQLTPLEGARRISSIAATLFDYDEFVLRELLPETVYATASARR